MSKLSLEYNTVKITTSKDKICGIIKNTKDKVRISIVSIPNTKQMFINKTSIESLLRDLYFITGIIELHIINDNNPGNVQSFPLELFYPIISINTIAKESNVVEDNDIFIEVNAVIKYFNEFFNYNMNDESSDQQIKLALTNRINGIVSDFMWAESKYHHDKLQRLSAAYDDIKTSVFNNPSMFVDYVGLVEEITRRAILGISELEDVTISDVHELVSKYVTGQLFIHSIHDKFSNIVPNSVSSEYIFHSDNTPDIGNNYSILFINNIIDCGIIDLNAVAFLIKTVVTYSLKNMSKTTICDNSTLSILDKAGIK